MSNTLEGKKSWLTLDTVFTVIAVVSAIFHFYIGIFRVMNPQFERAIHLMFGIIFAYLMFLKSKKSPKWEKGLMIALLAAGVSGCLYIILQYDAITYRYGLPNTTDIVFTILTILVVLDIGRRKTGIVLPIIAVVFILYAFFGYLIPGIMGHTGYSIKRISTALYLGMDGLWGTPIQVSATTIYLFMLFGSFISATGISNYYIDLAMGMFGRSVGGPAKISVVAAGLLGTVSGSANANVAAIGPVVIPIMRRAGYSSTSAAAVVSAASTGGQIMPPVMGAAAYIMAQFIGIPFKTIMLAAIIPACIYYIALYFSVHFEAKRLGLKSLSKAELPSLKPLLKRLYLFAPLVLLFLLLLLFNWSAMRSCVAAIVLCIVIGIVDPSITFNLKTVVSACIDSAKSSVVVIAACAVAGLVVGVINLTSLGLKLSNLIIQIGGSNMLLVLFMVMFSCVLMGMGLPTTAAYIIVAVLGVPALINLGIELLAAHMFVFYFACASMITPPVALAVYTACGIADSPFWRTGLRTVKIAIPVFLVPYFFVYYPQLLWQGAPWDVLQTAVTAVAGSIFMAAAVSGYLYRKLNPVFIVLVFLASIGMILPDIWTALAGILVLVGIYLYQRFIQAPREDREAAKLSS